MILGAIELGGIELGGDRSGFGSLIGPNNEFFFDATIKQVKMPTAIISNVSTANKTTQTANFPMNN